MHSKGPKCQCSDPMYRYNLWESFFFFFFYLFFYASGIASSVSGRRLLLVQQATSSTSSFQSPPYTQMTQIVNKDITQVTINTLTNYYLVSKGFNCSMTSSITGIAYMHIHIHIYLHMQYNFVGFVGQAPYNMQADYLEAQLPLPTQQLIPQLIAKANSM